ncbi:MAG: hypothetical protein GY846_04845 [Deltaproteobacteria bacterium]|nr:hypothetical protein [Deltaproteobacteria bacterium]
MEQDREAKVPEQVVERAVAKVGREVAGVVAGKAAAGPGRAETAFALPVAKKCHTRQAHPAMTGSVPNAAHP